MVKEPVYILTQKTIACQPVLAIMLSKTKKSKLKS
jgi:hypothetical protein